MPANRKRRASKKGKRLDVAATATFIPTHVPKRWVKLLVALFLLPVAGVLTQTFFNAFTRTTIRDHFWMTEEFWFFSMGAIMWLVVFFSLGRFVRVYVFGHELTHAIWVLLMGGKVHQFHVSKRGGHILADRTNTWIALAPYFFPIYSIIVVVIYGTCALFFDVTPYKQLLYALIGATWAFHLSFTCSMIMKGQPDLYYGGTFFSLTVIYILNLALLVGMLIFASPQLTARRFASELFHNSMDLTVDVTVFVHRVFIHFFG